MIGLAAFVWAIWKMRNRVVFDKKHVRSPTEIICCACSFIRYWAGLHVSQDKQALEAGAKALQETALYFHPKKQDGDATATAKDLIQTYAPAGAIVSN